MKNQVGLAAKGRCLSGKVSRSCGWSVRGRALGCSDVLRVEGLELGMQLVHVGECNVQRACPSSTRDWRYGYARGLVPANARCRPSAMGLSVLGLEVGRVMFRLEA